MNILIGFILLSVGTTFGYILCGLLTANDRCENICHCKNCNKTDGIINQKGNVWCRKHNEWIDANAFCSYGEERIK